MVDEVRRGVPAPAVALQQVRVAEVAHDDGEGAVVDRQLRRVGADVAADQAVAADDGETAHVEVGREVGQRRDQRLGVRAVQVAALAPAVGADRPHRVGQLDLHPAARRDSRDCGG